MRDQASPCRGNIQNAESITGAASTDNLRRFGFVNSHRRLFGEILGNSLRILVRVDIDDLAPSHLYDVDAPVTIG